MAEWIMLRSCFSQPPGRVDSSSERLTVSRWSRFAAAGRPAALAALGVIAVESALAQDIIREPLYFVDQPDVPLATVTTSSPITIVGLYGPEPITISGDPSSQYSIDGGAFTSEPGMVDNNSTVRARHTSSSQYATAVATVVTVGGVADTFTSITIGDPAITDHDGDGTMDAFDNCARAPNADQRDPDSDGYGSACDADLNNSGRVTALDYNLLRSRLNGSDPVADLDGDGLVTNVDAAILIVRLHQVPGPSGLHP